MQTSKLEVGRSGVRERDGRERDEGETKVIFDFAVKSQICPFVDFWRAKKSRSPSKTGRCNRAGRIERAKRREALFVFLLLWWSHLFSAQFSLLFV